MEIDHLAGQGRSSCEAAGKVSERSLLSASQKLSWNLQQGSDGDLVRYARRVCQTGENHRAEKKCACARQRWQVGGSTEVGGVDRFIDEVLSLPSKAAEQAGLLPGRREGRFRFEGRRRAQPRRARSRARSPEAARSHLVRYRPARAREASQNPASYWLEGFPG